MPSDDNSQIRDRPRQPLSLQERADHCVKLLQELKTKAETARRFHRTNPTLELLRSVERDTNDSLRSLQAWITQYTKGTQTTNTQSIESVSGLFSSLEQVIDTAYDALGSRLRYRRLWLVGFISHKRRKFERRLSRALQIIADTTGKLHAQLKVLLIDSYEQVDRQKKKQDVFESTSQAYKAFSEFFDGQASQDPQQFRTSALQLLWRHFPRWADLEGKVGSTEDPGDGLVYDSGQVTKATSILKDLHDAWEKKGDVSPCPPPKNLTKMVKICLILTGMNQQQLLEDFLDGNLDDDQLGRLTKDEVQKMLKGQHSIWAATFVTEQYRAVPREWKDGDHLEVEDEEPLPLICELLYKEGSYGMVNRVRDSFSEKLYARKQQIISGEERQTALARKHLEDETQRLKDLDHKHVVRLVKSYQRGKTYGILLWPAATSDLERLLVRFYNDKPYAEAGCKDSVWLRPTFLKGFGCLSQGLAYIHGRNIRHRDVKPANILYEKAMRHNDGARFIWADFGLAYDFSATGNSVTKSHKIHPKRYAAPEIVAANKTAARQDRKRSITLGSLDRITENGTGREMETDIELDAQTADDLSEKHGRKTDIFSLGCVFLELLAALVHDKLPLDTQSPEYPKEPMFASQLTELNAWAQKHQRDDKNRELAPLFNVALRMVSARPDDRPAVGDLVRKIAAVGKNHFCETCWEDYTRKSRASSSKAPVQTPASSLTRSPTEKLVQRVNSVMSPRARSQVKRLLPRSATTAV